jgi:hypothetical protein
MITLFYIWIFIGLFTGTMCVHFLYTDGTLVKGDDLTDTQHRIVLGIFIFLMLLIGAILGPIPLLFGLSQKNQ